MPLRRSLLARLIATSVLVAVCSIATTAWLAVQSTTRAIRQEHGQVIADDRRIHDTLTAHAAAHPGWDGVQPTLRRLARDTGRRIVLTTGERTLIAASSREDSPLARHASAVIDPLRTDAGADTAGSSATDGIDPRATGPYLLPAHEARALRAVADDAVACLNAGRVAASRDDTPSGRPRIRLAAPSQGVYLGEACPETDRLNRPTATERPALRHLNVLVNECLERRGLSGGAEVRPDFTWLTKLPLGKHAGTVEECVAQSRREQLARYVAPMALLFVTTPGGAEGPQFDLSRDNALRVTGVTGLVLALTVTVSAVLATRLVRPLRALTDAARHSARSPVRVPVTRHDETGILAQAFNEMSEGRLRMEQQRKDIVSDIAHELRTPLTNIRSWLEAAEDGLAPDPDLISSVLEEAMLLQHIIDDLQDLAAADAGNLRLNLRRVGVHDVLEQIAAAHRARADRDGIRLTTDTCTDTGEGLVLTADPVRLRQAVGNLVSNALRHTPPGGHVGLRARPEGGDIVIVVTDTGTGISEEDLPRVFDRFWRAERSRNRHTGGSGLGLPLVRHLAQAHGGTVSAESTLGEGSAFTLRLPADGDPR
ncbi:HAMP domain-containing sensor histidine kinase [Streptomyces sp. NPDC094143]|uniref:sensor histidine kinase n=1 Tax=Streptomyces sp. NPDC094143 TaxID=3155310 RepID=UPI00331953BE